MTGIGTIDRLKKKAMDTMHLSDEKPIPLKDIFGIGGYYTWFIPVGELYSVSSLLGRTGLLVSCTLSHGFKDPIFEDWDKTMGYATAQRLLREQMKEQSGGDMGYSGSVTSRTEQYPV